MKPTAYSQLLMCCALNGTLFHISFETICTVFTIQCAYFKSFVIICEYMLRHYGFFLDCDLDKYLIHGLDKKIR